MDLIFVKDFVHETEIGVYQSEFGKKQRLKFNVFLTIDYLSKNNFWNEIYLWIDKHLEEECSEYLISMMMEPYDRIIEPLVKNMSSDEEKYFNIPSNRKLIELKKIIELDALPY